MVSIYQGQTLNSSHINGYITRSDGAASDVFSISVELQDISTPDKRITPITVLGPIDPVRFSVGGYYAPWDVPIAEPEGTHKAIWRWKLAADSPERVGYEEFEVKSSSLLSPGEVYITPDDMYAEGFDPSDFSRDLLTSRIQFVQEYLERITGFSFLPRNKIFKLDGREFPVRVPLLRIPQPIISVSEIAYLRDMNDNWAIQNINDFTIYNRFDPDDRRNPKIMRKRVGDISIFSSSRFLGCDMPAGTQNIRITGVFGYVDEYSGTTPAPIVMVMKQLTALWMYELSSPILRAKMRNHAIIKEVTDGHQYQLNSQMTTGNLTGINAIDSVLRYYSRGDGVSASAI